MSYNILKAFNANSNHTSVDIQTTDAHSICYGVVILVGKDYNNMYSVIIQYDSDTIFIYSNLNKVLVREGTTVSALESIGTAKTYVKFECGTTNGVYKKWPVYVGNCTYFKQDPTPYLNGDIELDTPKVITNITSDDVFEDIQFTKAMLGEYDVNNRVDNVPNSI